MFLKREEIRSLLREIDRVTMAEGFLVVELQDVKNGNGINIEQVISFFIHPAETPRLAMFRGPDSWTVVHKLKNRCLLQKGFY